MKIYGIDFTSSPKRKPIACVECSLVGRKLHFRSRYEWNSFEGFERALTQPGPWIAGIDFPFGQSRIFAENIGWPNEWQNYVRHVKGLGRDGFRCALNAYRAPRKSGDKEHRRATDKLAKSISPQKLYGTPVALMFFEGAPRLLEAGVTIPGLQQGDPNRIVVEAYPGVLARSLIGRRSYKQDTKKKQTDEQHQARKDLLRKILEEGIRQDYGLSVDAPNSLTDDPTGDQLDALLCCIQAAWAWTQRDRNFGAPSQIDPIEGWIADPNANRY
jgi:hypothetical protein